MTEFCDFCGNFQPTSHIRSVDSNELMVSTKFNEAFKIFLPENFKIICGDCLQKLDDSYNFYQQVQLALQASIEVIKPEIVNVKVEIEPLSDNEVYCNLFGEFPSDTDIRSVQPPPKSKSKKTKKAKPKKSEIKFDSRGFKRPQRESLGLRSPRSIISLSEIFAREIKTGKFASETVSMDIPCEFKLKNGQISAKAKLIFGTKLWSHFSYDCPIENCEQPQHDNIIDLKRHLQLTHKQNHHATCLDCPKETVRFSAFLNHAVEHNPNLKFCCLFCSDFCHNFRDLYKHYTKHHENKKVYFCLYCGRFETAGTTLKEHVIKVHRPCELKFECDLCGKKTMLKGQMMNHLTNHRELNFQCDQCFMAFKSNGHLRFHKKEKHSGNHAICNECGKCFYSERRLRAHMKNVHIGNVDVSCEICGRQFNHPKKLETHQRVHDPNNEGKLKCPHCGKLFKYHSGFTYHIRSAHTGEKPYQCCVPGCDLRFYDFPNGMKHIKGHHKVDGKPIKLS